MMKCRLNIESASLRLLPLYSSVSAALGAEEKIARADPGFLGDDDRPLDGVLELADVARPGIGEHEIHRRLGEAREALIGLPRETS